MAFGFPINQFIIQAMKKFAALRKLRPKNDLKRPTNEKPSREYIHSLRGQFRGKGLMNALVNL
jgi:hypothetical protein